MSEVCSAVDLQRYRTLIFDCDGVILNSNPIKTTAFYESALPYGENEARALREYHIHNGGISRYQKFDWFLATVVGQNKPAPNEREALLKAYANHVWHALLTCEIDEALFELRRHTRQARWIVASGSDQQELRELFRIRGLDSLFEGGIFGSPRGKDEILADVEKVYEEFRPALFIGDAKYDAQVARKSGIDFLFVSHWSEVECPACELSVNSLYDCVWKSPI